MSAALDTIADIYDRDGFVFPIDVVDPAEASAGSTTSMGNTKPSRS